MDYRNWLPDHRPSRRSQATAHARRMAVRVLTRVSTVPALRPIGEAGMRALFDNVAPNWDRIRSEPEYREAFERALDDLPRHLPAARRPMSVLDVACGTGMATALLRQRFPRASVTGIDISPKMVELARSAVPGAEFVVASSASLPFEDARFGLVTTLDGVFEVHELIRVCAEGGVVMIVYSLGSRCPVARSVDDIAAAMEQAGMETVVDRGSSWVVFARKPAR